MDINTSTSNFSILQPNQQQADQSHSTSIEVNKVTPTENSSSQTQLENRKGLKPNFYSHTDRRPNSQRSSSISETNKDFERLNKTLNNTLDNVYNRKHGSLSNFGNLFKDSLQSGNQGFTHSLRDINFNGYSRPNNINLSDINFNNIETPKSFEIMLQTKDGDTIRFSINLEHSSEGDGGSSFTGISISFSIDGKLSKKEQEQLETFASALEDYTLEAAAGKNPSLENLPIFELSEISAGSIAIDGVETLNFKEDEKSREITVGNAQLTLDKTTPVGSNDAIKRQLSLDHFSSLLNKGKKEGDPASALEGAFRTLHKPLNELEKKDDTEDKTSLIKTDNIIKLNNNESALLTGLMDFTISYGTNEKEITGSPLERSPGSQESSLFISQKTHISLYPNDSIQSIRQVQQYELVSNTIEDTNPLSEGISDGFYKKTSSFESHRVISKQNFNESGKQTNAGILKEGRSEKHMEEYERGSLINEEHDINVYQEHIDKTNSLNNIKEEQDVELTSTTDAIYMSEDQRESTQAQGLLDEILIDPYDESRETTQVSI